jgi:geranylgeranyl diphosphate synthase type II
MDAQRRKATYPGVLGREEAKEWAQRLVATAIAELEIFGARAEPLREIAAYLLVRRS